VSKGGLEDSRVPADVRRYNFGDRYDIKRLQPGQLLAVAGEVVQHDCLTLGGNGGSSIVDLATGLVIACHYGGRWVDNKRGDAAALWKLRDRPALAQAGVEFR
jgi:endonuclease G, mitochondrial